VATKFTNLHVVTPSGETQMVPNLENIIMMRLSNINGIGTCDNNACNTKLQVIDNGDYSIATQQ